MTLLRVVAHAVWCPILWAMRYRGRVRWEERTLDLDGDVLRRLGPRCRRCGAPLL